MCGVKFVLDCIDMKTGVLLINLGTPSAPTPIAVKAYLDEFLMDPYVVDIPYPLRWLLVKGIILNTRPKQSAHAYQQIWTEAGSPLLVYSNDFFDKLNALVPENYQLALGMRYGSPSIREAAKTLRDCDRVCIFPLFPQYSLAATETAIVEAKRALQAEFSDDRITVVNDFFTSDFFLESWAGLLKEHYKPGYHLLFSYHGLPVKQLDKVASCRKLCSRKTDCCAMADYNRQCYRAQCYATTHAVAELLGIKRENYSIGFQSRLGKVPWIQPYTDDVLTHLSNQGIKKLQVACPSFVVDCLETLEEIGMRAQEDWLQLTQGEFELVPCLNSRQDWVQRVSDFISTL